MRASIHRRVLLSALGVLALGACMLVGASWWVLEHEMGEVFEDNLKQVALAVASHHGTSGTARQPRLAQELPRIYEEYGKFEFVVQVWSRSGQRLHTSDALAGLPFLTHSGLSTVSAGGEMWHIYTIALEDSIVQAAQRASERESLARGTASTLILPTVLILALIAGLLTFALRRGLAPLSVAAGEVTTRNVEALHPIALASQPAELQLLVSAINDLMARLGSALALQRNLVADAAHGLRTPIAALRLQLQLLDQAKDGAERELAVSELRSGVARAQHLIEQLLQLSRLAPDAPALAHEPLDLAALARRCVARFSARADERGIDLGAVAEEPVIASGDAQQLDILLDNLIDNALRYTPRGGRVDVRAARVGSRPRIEVSDSGPGIPKAERARVFDRFYRGQEAARAAAAPGSGLGLAIAQAVAQRHRAEIQLGDAPQGGCTVAVLFPPV